MDKFKRKRRDFTGFRLGKLQVIGINPTTVGIRLKWFCLCDCGTIVSRNIREMVRSKKKALEPRVAHCGCVAPKPKWKARPLPIRKWHQKTYKSEYDALCNAIHRCHNAEHMAYYNYGARGITVCDEWRASGGEGFQVYMETIGPRPDPLLTLDRIDNDGHYEPGNVRWASRKEQRANRRDSVKKVGS